MVSQLLRRESARATTRRHRTSARPRIETLEDRAVPALFQGTDSAVFLDPAPSSAVISGVGTNQIAWGTANFGTPPSSLRFTAGSGFDVDVDQLFTLGSLTFFNGTIALGTEITGIDFRLRATVNSPASVGAQDFRFYFAVTNTPNTGNPDADADSVFLPSSLVSQVFATPDGSQFSLELVGFGQVTGNGFNTIDRFHVRENASATAQLLGRFVRVPDLVASAFSYKVTGDATGESNGPIAVNLPYVITATVRNQGQGRSGTATVGVYLSADGVIDPATDIRIGTATLGALAPGGSTNLTINMASPTNWPNASTRFGTVTIGLAIDPDRLLPDGDFTNNQNRGVGTDSRPMQLYDAAPQVSRITLGVSYREAQRWLENNGYSAVGRLFGSGWSKPLSSSLTITSPFDGRSRTGNAYRLNAFIVRSQSGQGFDIHLQGTSTLAEPNPETALGYGLSWLLYVRDWHARY